MKVWHIWIDLRRPRITGRPSFWQPCPQGSFLMTSMPDHASVPDNDSLEVLQHICRG